MRTFKYLTICLILFLSSSIYAASIGGPIGGGGGGSGTGAATTNHYITTQAETNLSAETVASANGVSLITAINYAAMRTLLDLEVGVDFNAYDLDLTTWAGITPGTNVATALAIDIGADGAFVRNNGDSSTMTGYPTGAQPLAQPLTDFSNGIIDEFSNCRSSVPVSPVAGKKYCADNETGGWEPVTSVTGTVDYVVLYDGANYIAQFDKEGNILVNEFNISINASDGTYNGITLNLTAHETLAFGDTVFVNSDGEAALADADAAASMPCIGVVVIGGSAAATVTILTHGTVTETDWAFTAGGRQYVSETAGDIESTLSNISDTNDVVQIIGFALSGDTLFVEPSLAEVVLE